MVYVFTVGVLGVSSIAYWWARLGGAAVRAVHHVIDNSDELGLLLTADDMKLESHGSLSAPSNHRHSTLAVCPRVSIQLEKGRWAEQELSRLST